MATMIDQKDNNLAGEAMVYDCIQKNLPDDIICYYNREIKGRQFDYCLLIKNVGILIIEVKGWKASSIQSVKTPDEIYIEGYTDPVSSPKKQARAYRFNLVNEIVDRFKFNPKVLDMVCYPFLSENDYGRAGLKIVSEPDLTLFREDITDRHSFIAKIGRLFQIENINSYDAFNASRMEKVRSLFENLDSMDQEVQKSDYSRLSAYPSHITLSEIDDVMKSYISGTKQVVFVTYADDAVELVDNLNGILNKRHLVYQGNRFQLGEEKSTLEFKGNRFSIFNLEIYALDNLPSLCPDKLLIVNGHCDEEQKKILDFLGKNSTFNYEQYQVEHAPTDKDIQVRAGAGTGKTYSMISRISFLINPTSLSQVTLPSEQIAMATFTDSAASVMKTRLKNQFMNYFALTGNKVYFDLIADIERMRISTIHSFAKDLIQKTTLPLGVGTDFSTVNSRFDKKKILRRKLGEYIQKKLKVDRNYLFGLTDAYRIEDKLLDFAEKVYNKGCDLKTVSMSAFGNPPSAIPDFNDIIEQVIIPTEKEYAKELQDDNALNLLEYMLYLNRCVADESFNPNNFGFKYFFVDEFQDVDDSQISAFLLMQQKLHFHFFIVGDLKQSIYRFRGATMDAFSKMHCDDTTIWKQYSLTTNYRSDKELLNIYDGIFSTMGSDQLIPYTANDTLKGVKRNALPVDKIYQEIPYQKEDKSSGDFYKKLFSLVDARKTELEKDSKERKLSSAEKTIVILVRTNNEVGNILREAKKRKVLVETEVNGNLFKLQSSLDLCKLTSALCNPYSEVHLFDLIMSNNVNLQFNPEALVNKTDAEKRNILVGLLDTFYQQTMGKSWSDLVYAAQTQPVLKVLKEIYEATKPWANYSSYATAQQTYQVNHELLFENLSRMNRYSYLTLESINGMLTLDITTGADQKSRDVLSENEDIKVICTTVHRSKGLEYDTVILPETSDEIDKLHRNGTEVTYDNGKVGYFIGLGNSNSQAQGFSQYYLKDHEIDEMKMEESRILYVAMTRAINCFIWFKDINNDKVNWCSVLEEANHEN